MNKLTHFTKQHFFLWICCFVFLYSNAQPQNLSESAEISVLTCGTGDEMYTLFGHTALRVKDDVQNLDVVYNWGMFDFKTPNFLAKFVKGDLLYYLDVDRFNDFVYNYQEDNREIISQELNLNFEQKNKIWTEINRQLQSNDRFYTYSFIHNNCTTKVSDVLNKVLPKSIPTDIPSNNHSYRFILNEGLNAHYFEKLGINLLFGYSTNKQAELLFLPVKLKDGIAHEEPLVKSTEILNQKSEIQQKGLHFNSIYTLWAIVFITIVISVFNKFQYVYFTISGLFSLFLIAVSLYTQHTELYFNVLILFFNPLLTLAVFLKSKKMFYVAISLAVLSLFFMGFELISVVLPLIVLHLALITRVLFSKNKML